jgi:hypothetical protein
MLELPVLASSAFDWLNVAGVLIKTLATVIFTTYGVTRYQRWTNKRLWRLSEPLQTVVSVSTSGIHSVENTPMTGIGQVRALQNISPSIAKAYSNLKIPVFASQRVSTDKLTNDIIVIGGGRTNENAREILLNHSKNSRYKYHFDEFSVEFDGKKFSAEYWPGQQETQDNIAKDYAYVRVCKNPFNCQRRLILLIGIHTHGTEAAARVLIDIVLKRWYIPTNYEAFAEVRVKDQEILNLRLLAFKRLRS